MFKEITMFFLTVVSLTWRFFVAAFDWRTHIRYVLGQDILDVVFISNMRDEKDRRMFLGKYRPKCGHFNGPRYWIKGVAGRTRALDCTAEDFKTPEGRIRIRKLFVDTVQWAQDRGAKVVLLAASTKRLFKKKEIAELKKRFPNIIFTIGDNGTNLILQNEVKRALSSSALKNGNSKIAILGVYGFLGEMMTKVLTERKYNVIGVGKREHELTVMKDKYGIEICKDFDSTGKVDAVIACTHSDAYCLNKEKVNSLRRNKKKLLVVDVAEPSNLKHNEYTECTQEVIRQDAGNAYSPFLQYVLGPISYKMFRLSNGVTFGCFAEALTLCFFLKENGGINETNWFDVNDKNMICHHPHVSVRKLKLLT